MELQQIRESFVHAQKLTGQGSYERRAPNKKAIPFLAKTLKELKEFLDANPENAEAWSMLSLTEEAFLNYPAAIEALEKATSLSGKRDKKVMAREVVLREGLARWTDLALSPDELENLCQFLISNSAEDDCDHTLNQTEQWIKSHTDHDFKKIRKGLKSKGGYCDCTVVMNVMSG